MKILVVVNKLIFNEYQLINNIYYTDFNVRTK